MRKWFARYYQTNQEGFEAIDEVNKILGAKSEYLGPLVSAEASDNSDLDLDVDSEGEGNIGQYIAEYEKADVLEEESVPDEIDDSDNFQKPADEPIDDSGFITHTDYDNQSDDKDSEGRELTRGKGKNSSSRSIAWSYFSREPGTSNVICHLCGGRVKSSITKSMLKHLERCKPRSKSITNICKNKE